jgi:hypothetical protein
VSFLTDRYGAVGSGTLTAGTLTTSLSSLPGGSYNLTAHYPGDATFGGSDSSSIPVTIAPENSLVTLTTSMGSGNNISLPYGYYLFINAQVASASGTGTATGSVTFLDGNTPLATVPLDNTGLAEFSLCGTDSCLALGSHTITASYSGDNSLNAGAATQPLALTITKGVLASALSLRPPDSTVQEWMLQVFMYPPGYSDILPTGTVQFVDNATPLAPAQTLVSASPGAPPSAAVKVSLSPGVHNLGFNYSGDNNYIAFNSPSWAVSIPPPFGLSANNALASIKLGQSATYNLSLTSNYGYSGNVSLTCSGAPSWATCNIAPSTIQLASYRTTPLVVTVTTNQTASRHSSPLHTLPLVFAGVLAGLGAMYKKSLKAAAVVLGVWTILAVVGCGGGAGSNATPTPTPSPTPFPQSVAIVIAGSDGKTSTNVVLGLQVSR